MASALGGFTCSRNTLIVLNVLYIIIAFILIGTSTYANANAALIDYKVIGGIIACGVFLLIIALVGLMGTGLHHQVTLFIYMLALILLCIVQFSVACACLALRGNQLQTLFVMTWNNTEMPRKTKLQTTFDCCGATRESQNVIAHFENETGIGHLPCMNFTDGCQNLWNSTETCCTGNSSDNSTCSLNSCWDALDDDLHKAIRVVGVFGLVFSFTELIGAWLAYRYRNLKNPNVNPNAFL